MPKNEYITTTELADLLGISRVAVFKRIKKGKIKAIKNGRNFIIKREDIKDILGEGVDKKEVARVVKKAIKEYGETLKLLGQE